MLPIEKKRFPDIIHASVYNAYVGKGTWAVHQVGATWCYQEAVPFFLHQNLSFSNPMDNAKTFLTV